MANNYAVVLSPAFPDTDSRLRYWDGREFQTATDLTEYYSYTKDEAEKELEDAKAFVKRNEWMGKVYIDQLPEPEIDEDEGE